MREVAKAAGLSAALMGGALAAEPGRHEVTPAPEPTEQGSAAEKESPQLAHRIDLIRAAHPDLSFSLTEEESMDMAGNPAMGYTLFIDGKRIAFTSYAKDDDSFVAWANKYIEGANQK